MIFIQGFFHNFLDGFAIGVIFLTGSEALAISTFIAIFAHEIPHEIGDASIFLNSGFKGCQVILLNSINNISCVIGTLVGLGVGSEMSAVVSVRIQMYIAGNFIYLGFVSMWPEIMKT